MARRFYMVYRPYGADTLSDGDVVYWTPDKGARDRRCERRREHWSALTKREAEQTYGKDGVEEAERFFGRE